LMFIGVNYLKFVAAINSQNFYHIFNQ